MSRIETGIDLPSDGRRVWYYPGPTDGAVGKYGSAVRVTKSDGTKWYACFRCGSGGADGEFQFGTDDNAFLILASGAGYHVNCDDENDWREIPMSPFINTARLIPEIPSLLLFDWIQAAAYGPQGAMWCTPRLFMDDLTVVDADVSTISLRGSVLGGEDETILNTRDGSILKGRYFDWSNYALR